MVVVPEVLMGSWKGDEGDDYEKSCVVDSYAGLIDVDGGDALVLGDVPDDTAYLSKEMTFIRWGGAESEGQLIDWVQNGCLGGVEVQNITWNCKGRSFLFDSVYPADEINEFSEIPLVSGAYDVRVIVFSGSFSATAFRLSRGFYQG